MAMTTVAVDDDHNCDHDSATNGIQMTRTTLLPYFVKGVVVKGFSRGSKELGIPTANFEQMVVDQLPADLERGVYYGWAQIVPPPKHTGNTDAANSVYKMVASIGWNPFYRNEKKSMETHLLDVDCEDFYGSMLKVAIVGFIRMEQNFTCIDELIETIRQDLRYGSEALDSPEHASLKSHEFFAPKVETKSPQQNGY